jgi:hypothetical protein
LFAAIATQLWLQTRVSNNFEILKKTPMKLTSEEKEKARLKQVDTCKRLNLHYSEKLQDLVEIAGKCFSTPIVYISLIEEFKQVLLAKKGVTIKEMRREDTFCHHVIQNGTALIVNDTLKDSRFMSNSLVLHYPQIRFYAGTPLLSKNGFVLGAFCICDTKFRTLSKSDEQKLATFSELASNILEMNNIAAKPVESAEDENMDETDLALKNNKEIEKLAVVLDIDRKEVKSENYKLLKSHETNLSVVKKTYQMNPVVLSIPGVPVYTEPKIIEWGKLILEQSKRKASEISISKLVKTLANGFEENLKSKGNSLKLNINASAVIGDEDAIKFVSSNLMSNINNRNENSLITITTFDDENYSLIVFHHKGRPLLREELDMIFQSPPDAQESINEQELYFSWHTMKLIGGFLTVPQNTEEGNYITLGFPKNYLTKKWFT